MNRSAGFLLLLLLSATFSSCSFRKLVKGKKPKLYDWHTVQGSSDSNQITTVLPVAIPARQDTSAKLPDHNTDLVKLMDEVKPLWAKRLSYRTFKGKAKMHMEGPDNSEDFTANIRVRKDSVIWINVTALGGISFAKILITTDSFFMLNHLQKTVFAIPLSSAAKVLPTKVDFASLQNLILGEPLRGGIITDAEKKGDTISIVVEDSSYLQQIAYTRADSNMRTASLRMRRKDGDGPTAMTDYGDYEVVNSRKISTHRVLKLVNGNDNYLLEMNFIKNDFDEVIDFPFSIPRNYSYKK